MIQDVHNFPIVRLFDPEQGSEYLVPKYQREYVWNQRDWDALVDDLIEYQGVDGHFLGTFICVSRSTDSLSHAVLEVIDGQQRLTTLAILLATIHQVLHLDPDTGDLEGLADLVNLKRMLVRGRDPRLTPQIANSNRDDYRYILQTSGFDIGQPAPSYFGVRLLAKAQRHFAKRIEQHAEEQSLTTRAAAQDLLDRVKRAQMVKIEVNSYSDAFKLFESLNNRGKPLTPIDLIKNSLLAATDVYTTSTGDGLSMDTAYEHWSRWLAALGDDYSTQERFFRQMYSAMRDEWELSVPHAPVATKSNLIHIYETLIQRDVSSLVAHLSVSVEIFARINSWNRADSRASGSEPRFVALLRAQGTPAHILLMYLILTQDAAQLSDADLAEIVELLIAFSVRRNLTNQPPTNAVPRLFTEVISRVRDQPDEAVAIVRQSLISVSASDATFASALGGPIYEDNAGVARFVLVSLEEQRMTRETWQDLWARDRVAGGLEVYRWTIEHILPQTENLDPVWVDMLGGPQKAADTRETLVHHLGNLTISGYNSSLGKKSFLEKRDRTDDDERPIGYRNGLSLNADLKDRQDWNAEAIVTRTELLVAASVKLFSLAKAT